MNPEPRTPGHSALIVVDVQRDFCPGGALPAASGDAIVPAINRHLDDARARGMLVYASRDWHPAITTHFQAQGGPWPPHCVQGTHGAQFHPALALPADAIVVSKGMDPDRPGYSAFDGRTPDDRTLADDLRRRHVDHVYVAGIATEYCVKQTVLDARKNGFRVSVLRDAIAGIQPDDADRAVREMEQAGAQIDDQRLT